MASIETRQRGGERRYDVCWREPDGRKRSKTFRKRRDAEMFKSTVEADLVRGRYIDPDAGKVAFKSYAQQWLAMQTFNASTRIQVELRLRLHAYPFLGPKNLSDVRPSHVQAWLRGIDLAESTKQAVYTHVAAIFGAAVDDELIAKNPCRAPSVTRPRPERRKVVPWETERVLGVRDAMAERYKIAVTIASGLGLRQGEVFGLAVEDVDFLRGTVTVQRQIKIFGGNKAVFALPKYEKTRTVPLPASVRDPLAAYLGRFPAQKVTLPWGEPESNRAVTARLIMTTRERTAVNKNYFNTYVWKKALRDIGVEPVPWRDGMHALRHWYASALLDGGESIRALADYLGHTDPGFTLRVYTHLMPSSEERTKSAIDAVFAPALAGSTPDERAERG